MPIPKPPVPNVKAPNIVEYYSYFYYLYYYKTFLDRKEGGASPADAAAAAQRIAPLLAYEQMKFMFSKHEMDELGRAAGVLPPLSLLASTGSAPTAAPTAFHSVPALSSQQRSQKELGLTLMNDLMAKNGINLEEEQDLPTVLLQAARADRVSSAWETALEAAARAMQSAGFSGAHTRRLSAGSQSRKRSSLRGVLLSAE